MTRYTRYKKTYVEATGFVPLTQNKDQENISNNSNKKRKNGAEDKFKHDSSNEPSKVANAKVMKCFLCRKPGHSVQTCPANKDNSVLNSKTSVSTGLCYHCGSLQHSSKNCTHPNKKKNPFKFATCFHCNKSGHLVGQCPSNELGLYPEGGGCRFCGSVRHLAKDCKPAFRDGGSIKLGTISSEQGGDDDDVFLALHRIQKEKENAPLPAPARKKPKVVKF